MTDRRHEPKILDETSDYSQPSYSLRGVWIVNLTEFFVGLAASLGAVVMALVIFGEAVSSVQKAEYILATGSVFVGAVSLAFPVAWILSLTCWRRYHHKSPPLTSQYVMA